MPKRKHGVIDITKPMATEEGEESVHGDEAEDHPGYNLRKGPRQEELVHHEVRGVYQEDGQDVGVAIDKDEYHEQDYRMRRER